MSKEAEARVRDELLQSLYTATLRCTLAGASRGRGGDTGEAVAAGVCANLGPEDLVLLPRRGAPGFRLLRGLGPVPGPPAVALAAGVLTLPADEPQAVAFALGAAAAAYSRGGNAARPLVCVVLPHPLLPGGSARKAAQAPRDWAGGAACAAGLGLPLLLVGDRPRRSKPGPAPARPAYRLPAPLYPSIPVDRDDALAIYRVAFECATRARAGLGPSLLACVSVPAQPQVSPLSRLEAMLRQRGAFHKAWRRQLERQLLRELHG